MPAWHGDLLWDDDAHFTRVELRPLAGLGRIWVDVTATQQYYPLTHTAFWLMYHAWGTDTLGYHLVNILLHALSATLVAVILRRLKIPGAVLAAVIFALHPVHVESVAWMTELKNTLSGVFYLAAMLAYLRFDRDRSRRMYVVALLLFVLAMLSKTVVATLPGALLLIAWLQRGTLRWREDVLPVLPFVGVALAGGAATVWVEHTIIGAAGEEFGLTAGERVLVAGRAVWFYLGTLLWPANLTFIYPRWTISTAAWWQHLYPAATLAVLAILWRVRARTRAPLAVALFFIGTLFPALGFIDVYPFRFSFVADHFQYLASLGPLAALAAGLAILAGRGRRGLPQGALTVLVGLPLAILTWTQSGQYVDAETLYRRTLERNPACWLAHLNLGEIKLHGSPAELQEAVSHLQRTLELNPGSAEAHNNLGLAWQRLDRLDDAVREHREAIRLMPGLAEAHYNLGIALGRLGRSDEAVAAYQASLRIDPAQPAALHNLANVLVQVRRFDEAVARLREAAALDPESAAIHQGLGDALLRAGRIDDAIAVYREALGRHPKEEAGIRNNLAFALRQAGRLGEALAELEQAAQLMPGSAMIQRNLGSLLAAMGRHEDAVASYRRAIALEGEPAVADLHNELGLMLLELGRVQEAIDEFRAALRIRPGFAAARANLDRARAGGR
jgi:tetratricopeptide (TPR) repeat protein